MSTRNLMLQGTASSVGKSILTTAFCRIFSQDGYSTAPFKSQNMSNNSYVTEDGLEMGRAQVMQAEAAFKMPHVDMNPVLLKPTSEIGSQVIVSGKPVRDQAFGHMNAVKYFDYKQSLRRPIMEAYNRLAQENEIIVIEGAGSCCEINLKENDIVNMGLAQMVDAPVLLVGDIDPGGVFGALYGSVMLQDEADKKRIKGLIINKFRGDKTLLDPGLEMIEDLLQIPVLGVVPYFHLNLEDEDSVVDWKKFQKRDAVLDVVVISLPYISNFTDIHPLKDYPDVSIRFVGEAHTLGRPDLVILPGSKSVMHDLKWLKESGLAGLIRDYAAEGGTVFGICGGYQMMGTSISDPSMAESTVAEASGLGLIPMETEFALTKQTKRTCKTDTMFGQRIMGYEIHMGHAAYTGEVQSLMFDDQQRPEGYVNAQQTIIGTYCHGIFENAGFTRAFLNLLRSRKGLPEIRVQPEDFWQVKEENYNQLADIVRSSIDMEKVYQIMDGGV